MIIVGKWIGPKGKLSDAQLSHLLLIYVASGADILEILVIFSDARVSCIATYTYCVTNVHYRNY